MNIHIVFDSSVRGYLDENGDEDYRNTAIELDLPGAVCCDSSPIKIYSPGDIQDSQVLAPGVGYGFAELILLLSSTATRTIARIIPLQSPLSGPAD